MPPEIAQFINQHGIIGGFFLLMLFKVIEPYLPIAHKKAERRQGEPAHMKELTKKIDALYKAVMGNGDPKTGLVYKMDWIMDKLEEKVRK